MTKNSINKLLTDNQFVYPSVLIRSLINYNLSLNEFILLIYFYNKPNTSFDVDLISKITGMELSIIMESFSSLTERQLIKMNTIKDENNKMIDSISVDPLYEIINSYVINNVEKENKETIFSVFEREFGRTISPMEYEMINGWISMGNSEELILEALKEAVYNGVNNFRYIDKILYEWGKKGYKNANDVEKNRKERVESKEELFDYNWLDED